LIAYLARGRNYRTAYLSLTRGDGGQNVLGPEFGDELGIIRTEELLAARRVDGGRQFFSRAVDFGFSKDYLETLRIWDRQQVVSDIVRLIREFRPDVVIARFSHPAGRHARASHGLDRAGAGSLQARRRSEFVSRTTPRRADAVATQTHSLERRRQRNQRGPA
jgi:LmbE family N-acetylglucosaminyl deacetylase